MKIGLVDVDGHDFPSLPLMKLSAWHKAKGHTVEWYDPLFSGHMDKVYLSKVFSFTPDFGYEVDADEVVYGGTGYAITLQDGRETYSKAKDVPLPAEVEHTYPDYSLYGITDTAYGFLSRGCPRGCGFCHVADKEGKRSRKVADVSEFWQEQKHIKLMDPNILACPDWADLLEQLAGTKARIDINQGLDARLLSEDKVSALNSLRLDSVHFAWDRYEDSDKIVKGLQLYAEKAKNKIHGRYGTVYILVNYDTNEKQDLERIYTVRDLGYYPYVMIYNKANASKRYKAMQRWVNSPWIFRSCPDFRDYKA